MLETSYDLDDSKLVSFRKLISLGCYDVLSLSCDCIFLHLNVREESKRMFRYIATKLYNIFEYEELK